jgi:demethylmenaquinone methyltransferase/2-methoxy-6-polyprenyl-1,4-benzoquinol methylase
MANVKENQADFGFRTVPLEGKQALVDDVFHSVAARYDLMNDLMSGGLHRAWKEALVIAVNPPRAKGRPGRLDETKGRRITGADINPEMLAVGRERAAKAKHAIEFLQANAEQLPLPDRAFDVVTIAFGIRNVPRIETALAEAYRVLKTGGRFLCLEFSSVDIPAIDALYNVYSFNVIPALGRAVTGDAEAYKYLVESIRRFPRPERFAEMIQGAGFRRVTFTRLTGGMVALHSGWRL